MHPFDPVFAAAALTTIRASRWRIWLARLLGEKVVVADDGHWVLAYRWLGKLYLVDHGRM